MGKEIKRVLITIKSKKTGLSYDLDIPLNVRVRDLRKMLFDLCEKLDEKFAYSIKSSKIKVSHMKRYLSDEDVLYDLGVWDGSIIIVYN